MLKLKDGPVAGTYMCKRAPFWLRAVVDANGKKDVLDQLDDEPAATEKVYVYRCVSEVGHVHINAKRGRGFYAMADYEYLADVDGDGQPDVIYESDEAIGRHNCYRPPAFVKGRSYMYGFDQGEIPFQGGPCR